MNPVVTLTDAPDREAEQAPEFYERHGYRRFGTIDCQPPGTSRIFLSKGAGLVDTRPAGS